MEILGYILAVIVGLTLGLTGGGGSILTVPVLVYLVGVNPVLATAYSLFIVGASSLVGAISFMRQNLVHYKSAVIFGLPALVAVYATRKFIMPMVPEYIVETSSFTLTKDVFIMVFFSIIMIVAAISMIRKKKQNNTDEPLKITYNYPMILLEGLIVGVVTGFIGAGGGFLIIPALVVFAKMPMKLAVGTSLLIIAIKSLIGFLGDVSEQSIEWNFLLIFTALTVVGIFAGIALNKKISAQSLKKGFGWFVLAMGAFIITKEILTK